jgi:hypothetical protein
MRKVIVSLLGVLVMVSASLAAYLPYGSSAKYAAMGGAGSAIADDISTAYYNPAGILSTGNMDVKLGLGAATENLSDILALAGTTNDPAKLVTDNFSKKLDINGSMFGLVGINVAKVGITILPFGSLVAAKDANSANGSATALLGYEGIITLGYGLSLPGLPIAKLDLGTNIKYGNLSFGYANVSGTSTSTAKIPLSAVPYFDLGARAKFDNFAFPISGAIVMRDINANLKGTLKLDTNGTSLGEGNFETNLYTPPSTTIGLATTIPVVGLKVAIDYDAIGSTTTTVASIGAVVPASTTKTDGFSLTRLGLEYPVLGILAIRAGYITGNNGNTSITTVGAGLNFLGNLDVAMIMDSKNSKNNSTMVDLGFAF